MKKQILISLILLSSVIPMTAQTLYLPNGTGGIGNNTINSNVGIGTGNPQAELDVIGTITSNELITTPRIRPYDQGKGSIDFTNNGFGYIYATKFFTFRSPVEDYGMTNDYGVGTSAHLAIVARTNDGSGNIGFYAGSSNADERMRIASNGNIGIGTSTPQVKLDVVGTIRSNSLITTSLLRPQDQGSGAIDFTNNGFGHAYSTKFFTFRSPDYSEAYGMTNDYGAGTSAHLAIVAKTSNGGGNIGFYAGNNTIERMRIAANGSIGIGTSTPDSRFKLDVEGTIRASEVKVCLQGGCDFVFKSDYKLMKLNELEKFVKTNNHLPEVAPEKEMVENGVNMKELQMRLLQKIEELTLYIIEQNKLNEQQNTKIKSLEEEIKKLKAASK